MKQAEQSYQWFAVRADLPNVACGPWPTQEKARSAMRRMLGFEASGLRWKGEQAIVRGRAIGRVFGKAAE